MNKHARTMNKHTRKMNEMNEHKRPCVVSVKDEQIAGNFVDLVPQMGRSTVTDDVRKKACLKIARDIMKSKPKHAWIQMIDNGEYELRHVDGSPWELDDVFGWIDARMARILKEGELEAALREQIANGTR
jgi:hypothetical protein